MKVNFIASASLVLLLVFSAAAYAASDDAPPPGSAKKLPTAVMKINIVGSDYIFANERQFLINNNTVVNNGVGASVAASQLRLGQTVSIEYHADEKGRLVADSIKVTGSDD